MTMRPLREHVRDHYASQTLSPTALERLVRLALPGGPLAAARTRLPAWLAVAAAVALLAGNVYLVQRVRSAEAQADALRAQLAEPRGGGAADGALEPRFVTVRTYSEHCAYCRHTAGVYDALRSEFAGQPVAFVAMDATDEKASGTDQQVARCMGIDWAQGICRECCCIRLLDRKEQKVIAVQMAPDQGTTLRDALVAALATERP